MLGDHAFVIDCANRAIIPPQLGTMVHSSPARRRCKPLRELIMTTTTTHTPEQMTALIAKLQAENAALRAQPAKRMTMKVSEKGALSVYGLGHRGHLSTGVAPKFCLCVRGRGAG